MKIIYTTSEATTALTRHHATATFPNTVVEIVPDSQPVDTVGRGMNHLEAYATIIGTYGESRFSNNKIAAIKKLRELINGLGLAEAKYIIEATPSNVLSYYYRNNELHGYPTR